MNEFLWLDGRTERCIVHRINGRRAYVSWPDSVRQLNGATVMRPSGWVDAQRIDAGIVARAIYTEFVDAP